MGLIQPILRWFFLNEGPSAAKVVISEICPDFKIPYDIRGRNNILSHSTIAQAIIDIIEIPTYNYKRDTVVRLLKSPYIWVRLEGEGKKKLLGYQVDFESRAANIIERKRGLEKISVSIG